MRASFSWQTLSVLFFLAYTCFARIVPAKRKVVLRHAFTQRKREIGPGLRLQWPWESAVTAFLPLGDRVIEISDFDLYYRYDPRPYVVGTRDKVEAYVDVRIDCTRS